MNFLIFLFPIIATSLALHIGSEKGDVVVPDRFDNTCGIKNIPIVWKITNMRLRGHYLTLTSVANVRRDLSVHMKGTLTYERCKTKEDPDTCEHFYTHNVDDYCFFIAYSPFHYYFAAHQPSYRCPIKKGVYRANNVTVDMLAFVLFPVDTYYWRMTMTIQEKDNNDALVLCWKVAALITN